MKQDWGRDDLAGMCLKGEDCVYQAASRDSRGGNIA